MWLREAVAVLLLSFAAAGPVARDVAPCAEECSGDSKFEYSEKNTYVYSYESTNTLEMSGSSQLSTGMKATVEITRLSKCEMALQIGDVSVRHGSSTESTSPYIDRLKQHALRFAWNDGKITHVCPHPADTEEAKNLKKGILSAFQNSMKTLAHDSIVRETDVLGSCDTHYKIKDHGVERITIHKTKNLASCSDHVKGKTGFIADPYESTASPFQHLPLITDRTYACHYVVKEGLAEEVFCSEKGVYKPLSEYSYSVKATGEVKLQMLSTTPAKAPTVGSSKKKEKLVFIYEPKVHESKESDATKLLQQLCTKAKGMFENDVGLLIHKLVHTLRGLESSSIQSIYESLKSRSLCKSRKVLDIFVDSLKAASSEGAVEFLTKLVTSSELSTPETLLWMAAMPFTSHPDEGAVLAAAPLIRKESNVKQAMLSVPAMAHKFCRQHPTCESTAAIQSVISNLQDYLGANCKPAPAEEEEVVDALKGFGNLGYVGSAKDAIFKCASESGNSIQLRIAALEAFRRSPCSDSISSQLLEIYENMNENDEVRIAALIALSKCPSPPIVHRVHKTYESEKSKQVEVFTWSLFEGLKSSSDPLKRNSKFAASQLLLKKPDSVDVTKFSRHISISRFMDELNIGYDIQSNLIHSQESYLPRSGNLDVKVDIFGHQLNIFEVGLRAENLDYEIERLFGPKGIIPLKIFPSPPKKREVSDSTADVYRSRIEGLKDKINLKRKHPPTGTYYFRILGNELRWRTVDTELLEKLRNINFKQFFNQFSDFKKMDVGHSIVFLDNSILIPSVSGRAYKLAANGSATIGATSEMKLNVQDLRPGNLQFYMKVKDDKPSVAVAVSASMSIHSEDYEPGVFVDTTLNAGLQGKGELSIDKGPSIDWKFDYPTEKTEVFSMKREFYELDKDGRRPVKQPKTHDLSYCTRYLQKIVGLKVCGQMTIPHAINEDGKPTIPFLGPMEASLHVNKEDSSIKGYEFTFRLPASMDDDRREFRLGFDTPGSSTNRKFLTELILDNSEKSTASFKFHTPIYTLDADASCLSQPEKLEVKVDVLGDKKRRYIFDLDVEKDIKGARLAAYKPTLTITLPKRNPVRFSGTVVFAKGRKEQISIDVSSDSFENEFLLKGNIAKEGTFGALDSEFHVVTDLTMHAAQGKYRLQESYKRVKTDINYDLDIDYQRVGSSMQSIKVKSLIKNVSFWNPLRFNIENEMRLSQFPDFNTKVLWNFSFKPGEHLRDDMSIRYGRDFQNDERHIQSTLVNVLDGDFVSFSRMNYEYKIQIKIPQLKCDKAAFFRVFWDVTDRPKFESDIGLKFDTDRYLKSEVRFESFSQLNQRPIKLTVEAKVTVFNYEFLFRDEIQETSPNLLQGRAILKPFTEKQIDIDYVYAIRSVDRVFYHELESTIVVPGYSVPIQQKLRVKRSQNVLEISSRTDTGNESPYTFDIKLNRDGPSELSVDIPAVKGSLKVDRQPEGTSFEVDIRTRGRDERHMTGSGRFIPGDTDTMDLELAWNGGGDPDQKVVVSGKARKTGEGRTIVANINYANSITVEVSGKLSNRLLYGPHDLQAVFSGNMEPMSIIAKHEIANGHMNSYVKYLRSNTEKLRADLTGKFIHRSLHFETEGRLLLISPYKAFDGKEIYGHFLVDSNDVSRSLVSEYRLKSGPVVGYVGKIEYRRKRGFPGHVKLLAISTAHRRTVAEIVAGLEYGGGKYSVKASMIPSPNRKMNFETSLEVAARYAAFRHSFETTLQYLQLISLNAVADMRNSENLKMHSNFDINTYKVYDVNATLTTRSILDFEGQLVISGKLAPSFQLFTKTNNANSVTKYSLTMHKGSNELLTGKGEIKKRKKGFSGDIVFAYKGKDFLTLTVTNEAKSQRARSYVFRLKSLIRTYTISIQMQKDKKSSKHSFALCRNEDENCVNVETFHKEEDGKNEWQVRYKRATIDLSFDRIIADTEDSYQRTFVVHSGEKRYGYEVRYKFGEENIRNAYIGFIFPSRKVSIDSRVTFSASNPALKLEILADALKHPDRKLIVNVKADNQILSDLPSKLQISIAHPIFEKPIDIKVIANYDGRKPRFFEGEYSIDYSLNPEDKLIYKLYAEKVEDGVYHVNLDIYHQDEGNLDFQVKTDALNTNEYSEFGMKWIWKDDKDQEQNANLRLKRMKKERKFTFLYNRPKLDFRLEVAATPFESLHQDVFQMDVEMEFNGAVKKANLIYDSQSNCRQLNLLGEDGSITRKAELCTNMLSSTLVSFKTMSREEDMWVFDYSYELTQPQFGTINLRHHWNPEFLGGLVFQYNQLADELLEAGFGKLPIFSSPRYQIMEKSVEEKLTRPIKEFVTEEAKKVRNEIIEEAHFLKEKLYQYYDTLPSIGYVRRLLRAMKPAFEELWEGFVDYLYQVKEELTRLANILLDRVKDVFARLKQHCGSVAECELLVQVVSDRDWERLPELYRMLISRLPESVRKYVEEDGIIENWLRKAYAEIKERAEPIIQSPVTQQLLDQLEELYYELKQEYVKLVSQTMHFIIQTKERVMRDERVKKIIAFFSRNYKEVINDILQLDYAAYYQSAKSYFEDLLTRIQLPSPRSFFKINALDAERGVFDIDIYAPVDLSVISRITGSLFNSLYRMKDAPQHFTWKNILVKLKRVADYNFIPPYKEQALLLGQTHYVTFDKTFYDFAGDCAYLLASDLEDGNFSIVLTPTFSLTADKSEDRRLSLGMFVKGVAVLIDLEDKMVKAGEDVIDLPYETSSLSVTREGNVIVIDDNYGVQVKCHVIHEVCTATISGFYFGKTAGLLGTYNYEPADDFRRPRGQIPNAVTTFAKSYDISKGCKTKNLAKDVKLDKSSSNYKLCTEYFGDSESPLAACFSEVKPDEFLALCYRHVSTQSDKQKAVCNTAAAYVMECEKNYVELNLPPKCLSCESPDGSKMKHGDRKEFKNFKPSSSDVIFVVEAASCNAPLLSDLDNLARFIDRELTNEGMTNNLYGTVVYKANEEPRIYTSKGKVLFGVGDVAELARRIDTASAAGESEALEALELAVTFPFRSGSAKSIVLLSCSPCVYNYKSLLYPVIQQILLRREITLHTISSQEIRHRKSSKEKSIIGIDADTVYHVKDVTQKTLVGEPDMRSQVSLPKDACAALAQDVNGSFFSTQMFRKETKSWRSIFSRRLVKTAKTDSCRLCDCTSTADHVAQVICETCETRKPRLPFSVCKSCNYPSALTAFYSYLLHVVL